MKRTVELMGMEFHSFHGCFPEERLNGADYLVDFSCEYDFFPAMESDDLADTIDYGRIYDIVACQMSMPSNLLEHVAGRIVAAISQEFPQLLHYSLKLSKLNPPTSGHSARASVILEI